MLNALIELGKAVELHQKFCKDAEGGKTSAKLDKEWDKMMTQFHRFHQIAGFENDWEFETSDFYRYFELMENEEKRLKVARKYWIAG